MKQYPIHELEARRDWPVIVTSVECPTCGAAKGERCKQIASALAGFGQQSDRIDFHAARKYAAAQFLEEHPFPSAEKAETEVSGTKLITPDPFKEIQEGKVPEHIQEMRTPPKPRRTKKNTPTSE